MECLSVTEPHTGRDHGVQETCRLPSTPRAAPTQMRNLHIAIVIATPRDSNCSRRE